MPPFSTRQSVIIGLIALVAVLLAAGFRADGLPFAPGARYSDSSTSHYPAALFLRESVLERSEFPLWREAFMAGAPFAANPLNKAAYPLAWFGLVLEPLLLLNGLVVAHFLIAGAGMWRWARALGISTNGSLVSALAYMVAPRLLGHLGAGHLDILYALAWWPWLMWSAGRLGARANWRWALLTGLCAGSMVLADVRMALYGLPSAAVAFFIGWQRAGRAPITLGYGALSTALALGLSVAVIAPVVGWSPWLTREALTPVESGANLLSLAGLSGLIIPVPGGGGHETLTYLGAGTLVLAVIGAFVLPRRWRTALGMFLLVAALLALGSNGPIWPLLAGVGGLLSWFRVPARIWFIVVLLAAPLAGLGVDALVEAVPRITAHPVRLRRLRLAAFALLIVTLSVGLLLVLAVPAARLNGWQVLMAGGALGAVLLLALAGRLAGRRLFALLVLLMVVDSAFSARTWIDWRPSTDWLDPTRAVTDVLKADDAARVYSPSYSLPQEAMAEAGLRLFGGVDPFQIEGVSAAIMRAGGIETSGYSIVMPPLREDEAPTDFNRGAPLDPALLAEWDVSHVVASYPIEHPSLALLTEIDGTYIYRNMLHRPMPTAAPPDFPAGWPDLPDRVEVAHLNNLALTAWAGSMALLVISLSLLGGALLAARKPEEVV
ncbi:MAG TPA: hypothetical protein VER79_13390 [Candidatus Limnocylindrales bacterium]|nr:hypothetical protein [Candidatus Limnocylindrales bacterium]